MTVVRSIVKLETDPIRSAPRIIHSPLDVVDDYGEVPFVTAWDLVEEQGRELTSDKLAAIAMALYLILPDEGVETVSSWGMQGRIEGLRGS